MWSRRLHFTVLVGLVLLLRSTRGAEAQRRVRVPGHLGYAMWMPTSARQWRDPTHGEIAAARRAMDTVSDALEALGEVEFEPGDANQELRSWDRRWGQRMIGIQNSLGRGCGLVHGSSCRAYLFRALICHSGGTIAVPVIRARHDLGRGEMSNAGWYIDFDRRDRHVEDLEGRIERHETCEDFSPNQ